MIGLLLTLITSESMTHIDNFPNSKLSSRSEALQESSEEKRIESLRLIEQREVKNEESRQESETK